MSFVPEANSGPKSHVAVPGTEHHLPWILPVLVLLITVFVSSPWLRSFVLGKKQAAAAQPKDSLAERLRKLVRRTRENIFKDVNPRGTGRTAAVRHAAAPRRG